LDGIRELIKRRSAREPLQHIIGSTSFCGLEIGVDRHVLIPRPETELLAEQGWIFLNALSREGREGATVLDFGTGSGCLAIVLAVKCPHTRIAAVDISADALERARHNAAKHGVAERLDFYLGDGFGPLPDGSRFALIISNPPYIATAEIDSLELEVRTHDPRQALDGGVDGLDFHRRLAVEAGDFLEPGGKMILEFGDHQAEAVHKLLANQNWIVENILTDYNERPRILIARRPS